MPIAQMKTNYKMDKPTRKKFADETAMTISEILQKPISTVMVMIDDSYMYMNSSEDTAFFSEFRYILPDEYKENKSDFLKLFADKMLMVIMKYTHANPYRVYMQFTEMTREGAWRYTE